MQDVQEDVPGPLQVTQLESQATQLLFPRLEY